MARNCITSLLAASMLLCTLSMAGAQQGQPPAQAPVQSRENIGNSIPPSWGGLPNDTPARPQTVLPTPPVHDIPPSRGAPQLSADQQLQLQKDLSAARARNLKLEDPNAAKKADSATAANAAAIERARKKAGKLPAKPASTPPRQ